MTERLRVADVAADLTETQNRVNEHGERLARHDSELVDLKELVRATTESVELDPHAVLAKLRGFKHLVQAASAEARRAADAFQALDLGPIDDAIAIVEHAKTMRRAERLLETPWPTRPPAAE